MDVVDVVERSLASGSPDWLGTLLVAALILLIGGGIVWRLVRYLRLRAATDAGGWRRIGRARAFGELVLGAFPEVAARAERAARRNANRTGTSNRRGRGATLERLSRSALDSAGMGLTRTQTRATGVHAAVAPTDIGEVNVGEVRVSATARQRRTPLSGRGGVGRSSSSTSHAAAAATVSPTLPAIQLAPRSLTDRVLGGGHDDLPGELASRFEVRHLPADARAAYLDSGAYRALLDGTPVDGVVVADGRIVLFSRRRLSPGRARGLVTALEAFLAAVPDGHRPDDLRLGAPVTG